MSAPSKDDELLAALADSLEKDMLDPDMPIGAVRTELQNAGLDHKRIGTETAQLFANLSKQRRLAWRSRAAENRESMRSKIRQRAEDIIRFGRARIEQEIERLRNNPLTNAQVVTAFRKRDPRSSTDQELAELLLELYALTDIAHDDGDVK